MNETRAETHNVAAAQLQYKSARDLVVLVAGNGYLQALAAASRADSVRAQLDTAQALYTQAGDLKQAGLVAGIDVLRAEVQLNLQKQRSTAALNEFEKAKLQLARLIGLPIGQAFTLNPTLPDIPAPDLTLDVALDRAYRTRGDYLAAQERVRAAESSREASAGEGLPTVRVNADYGDTVDVACRLATDICRERFTHGPDPPERAHARTPARSRRRPEESESRARGHEGGHLL